MSLLIVTYRTSSAMFNCYQKKMILYRTFILLIAMLFISAASCAQKILSVDEAIANALQKNYGIILAKTDSAIAAIDYSYRNAAFLPQLNGNAGIAWTNNNQTQTLS